MAFKVSTQTIIIKTSITSINLDTLFDNAIISDKVLGVKFRTQSKGDIAKTQQSSLNTLVCLTMRIRTDARRQLTVKVFGNGTVQATGCKSEDDALFAAIIVFALMNQPVSFHLMSVMRNVSFDVGFQINREKIATHLRTSGYSVAPLTSGYTGVKVSMSLPTAKTDIVYSHFKWDPIEGHSRHPSGDLTFSEMHSGIKKKMEKPHVASVSICQNGKVLVSAANQPLVDAACTEIVSLISKDRAIVEIKQRAKKTFIRNI